MAEQVPWDSQWYQVVGFPDYWVNQYQQVINLRTGRIISQWSNRWSMSVSLFKRADYTKNYSRKVSKLLEDAVYARGGPQPHPIELSRNQE